MSIESVKAHLAKWNRDKDIMEFNTSSATVEQAADAIGVIPARIAKTLSFKDSEGNGFLVVAAGDAKIDNQKFKATFGIKAKMLTFDEVVEETGHIVGGVCPFGLRKELKVYLDQSMKRFETLYPACGSSNSAIELTLDELMEYSEALDWVDVCKDWE